MTCATSHQPVRQPGVIRVLLRSAVHRIAEWNNRRALRRVLDLNAHLLRDIGLTHGDIEAATRQRLSADAGTKLMASRNPFVR
jgi:uncharacterized protein YjiS (DUF1127 family)